MSAITILGLEMGIFALDRRKTPRGSALRIRLSGVREAFAGQILPLTDRTATVCASLHVPNPRLQRDAMVVATAMEHSFTVVTRNVSDFAHTGVALVNPRKG